MDKTLKLERIGDNDYKLESENLVVEDVFNAAGYLLYYATYALLLNKEFTNKDKENVIRYTMRAIESSLIDTLTEQGTIDKSNIN